MKALNSLTEFFYTTAQYLVDFLENKFIYTVMMNTFRDL